MLRALNFFWSASFYRTVDTEHIEHDATNTASRSQFRPQYRPYFPTIIVAAMAL